MVTSMMLALDVNLLTTKLQKQTLDEAKPNTANIKLINPDTGYKLSESAQAKLGAVGQGKKLWTVSINSETGARASSGQFSVPQNPLDLKLVQSGSVAGGGLHVTTKLLCSHKKPQHLCGQCDNVSSLLANNHGNSNHGSHTGAAVSTHTFAERPKKRHCRSISVPQETEINIPPAKSSWQPQGSRLWKPVAMNNCGKWDVRSVHWSPTDCRNYEFASIAPSLQRQLETGHITPDDLLTPPESPIPRPSSVYSDGAISPFTGSEFYPDYSTNKLYLMSEFRNRSLSLEDKICTTTSCMGSATSVPGLVSSMPSSPHHRYRVPRCRSQPTFYDRKSGRRRRRDCRPTLNFNKMTETAYGQKRLSDPLATPTKDHRQESRFHDELESVMSLMPIASSPRDTDMPTMQRGLAQMVSNTRNSPILELEFVNRDSVTNSEIQETGSGSGPVKLLGDVEEDENDMEVFQLTEELDLEQIENH